MPSIPPSHPLHSRLHDEAPGGSTLNESPIPETRYVRIGDVSIAYQVIGNGPLDLVHIPSWITNVEENWNDPGYARFLRRLASFSRLIVFDKRGTGLSDRIISTATLEERIEDVHAVMEAVGSDNAALFGSTEGSAMCALFAATFPERTRALVMYGAYARRLRSITYPWGPTEAERERFHEQIAREWGGPVAVELLARGAMHDERFCRWWAGYLRRSASPGAAMSLARMNVGIDIRDILPTIRVPTLVLHRTDDPLCPVEGARYIVDRIPGARLVEVPGSSHMPFVGDTDALLDPVQEFLTGTSPVAELDRVLTTIMVIDVVDSTSRASVLGDQRWRPVLDGFRQVVRQELARFRGEERNMTGDGFVATFDGPGRAVHCASAIVRAVRALGLEVRVGVHTGECTLSGPDLDGVAVHIAARASAMAGASEVFVTSTVKDLVAGSIIGFNDRGRHTLRGIPGIWALFSIDTGL